MAKFKNSNCDITHSNCEEEEKLDSRNSDGSNSNFFSKKNLYALTTDEMFEGQRFAILVMFFCLDQLH